MRTILLLIFAALTFQAYAQNPSAQFAKWKNNAQAVYTLTHDDYASFWIDGIQEYADTIAYNRGVKFTFGVITGSCDEADWLVAKRLISHGHEVMNHTHTHACNHVTPDCPYGGWDYAIELDQSTNLIFTNTGSYPRYFIWPYDVYDQASKDYLKNKLHYYGGRGGESKDTLEPMQLNGRDIPDFFNTNFSIFSPTTNKAQLNALVDLSITQGKWGLREVHGVNDLSYASIPLADYRNHCDYIKSKVDAGLLWNANASEVTTYLMQARAFVPAVTYQPQYGRIKIAWNNPVLDVSDLRSPVTLNVKLDGLLGYDQVYQGSQQLSLVNHGDSVSINCYPHKGEVYLYNYDPSAVSFTFEQSRTLVRQGEQGVLYRISEHAANEYLWHYTDAATTLHTANDQVTLDFSSASVNGTLMVYVVKNGKVSLPQSVNIFTLAVNDVQYNCPLPAQGMFNITNQSNKFLWYVAPVGGNALSYSNQLAVKNIMAADTLYIAAKTDSVSQNIPIGENLTNVVYSTAAKKITIEQPLKLTKLLFKVYQYGMKTVDIYKANGQTQIFTLSQYVSSYSIASIPVNLILDPGEYFIKITGDAYADNSDLTARNYSGMLTVQAGGYEANGDGSINFSSNRNASQLVKIGLELIRPLSTSTERIAVYAKPIPPAAPVSYSGPQQVCGGKGYLYYPEWVSSVTTYLYRYSDGTYDTTVSSNVGVGAYVNFRDRNASGVMKLQYKNACGVSNALEIPITVSKPEFTINSYTNPVLYPGDAVVNYTKVPGTDVTLSYQGSNGGSVVSETDQQMRIRFTPAIIRYYTHGMTYTISKNGCSRSGSVSFTMVKDFAPEVSITYPADGQIFPVNAHIGLQAMASILDNAQLRSGNSVEFISDDGQISGFIPAAERSFSTDFSYELWTSSFPGRYRMIVSSFDEEAYRGSSQSIVFYTKEQLPTSVSIEQGNVASAYPNPTMGKVYIQSALSDAHQATLTDVMGKSYTLGVKLSNEQLEIDLSELPCGLYELHLQSEEKMFNCKVVKIESH